MSEDSPGYGIIKTIYCQSCGKILVTNDKSITYKSYCECQPNITKTFGNPSINFSNKEFFNFSKIRKVKSPTRGTSGSAGIDFYIPEFEDSFIEDLKNKNVNDHFTLDLNKKIISIPSGGGILIPSGIKAKFDSNYVLIAFNKSGVASKRHLICGGAVVDSDYQGEIHIQLQNVSTKSQEITEGDKIIQFILLPTVYPVPNEVYINNLYEVSSERGEGGFGSTNVKG